MEGLQVGAGVQWESCKRKREVAGVVPGTDEAAEDFATQVTPLPADRWAMVAGEAWHCQLLPWDRGSRQCQRDPTPSFIPQQEPHQTKPGTIARKR